MQYDDILEYIGGMGRFQIMLFNILAFMAWKAAFNALVVTFQAVRPDFLCLANLPSFNETHETGSNDVWNLAKNYTDSLNSSDVKCTAYSDNSSATQDCSSWMYDRSSWDETITTEWDLVCGRSSMEPLLFASYAAGQACGIFVGFLADKFGRCKIIRIFIVFEGATTLLQAASPHFYVYLILRFSQGFFSCVFLLASVTCTEFVGASYRALVSNCFWLFWCLGYITVPGLAYLIRSWRLLQLAICVPTAAYILVFIFLPESPRWLLANNKTQDAIDVCKIIARVNKKTMPPISLETVSTETVMNNSVPSGRIRDLFATRTMTKKTVVLFLAWGTISFTYFGISLDAKFVSPNKFLTVALSGVMELPAYAGAYLVAQRLGRRWPLVTMYLVLAISLLAINLVPQDSAARIVIALIAKLMVTAAFSLLINYSTELYPTTIRNFGVFCCNTISRLTAIIAPFFAMNENIPRLASTLLFAILSGTSGICLLMLPETRNIPLPQTVKDADLLKPGKEKNYYDMIARRKAEFAVYFVTSTETLSIFSTATTQQQQSHLPTPTAARTQQLQSNDDDQVIFASSKYLIDPYS